MDAPSRPRRYRMTRRAEAAAATRRRIVAAARELHATQGIVTTSHEDIAVRAGVSQATVYRHFPSLDSLIPACATGIVVLEPTTADHAAELFVGLETPRARIARLVEGTCDCYRRDGAWLHVARVEDRLHPALGTLAALAVENLRFLVHAALAGAQVTRNAERTVIALIDYPFWRSLQAAGFSEVQARRQVMALVSAQIADRVAEGNDQQ